MPSLTKVAPLSLRGRTFAWGTRTFVMGIVNATPDSFSGDGVGGDVGRAVAQAGAFAAAGCDIIDVGGESTRPGHTPVDEQSEADRVLPIVRALRAALDLPISIDTSKPAVAQAALDAGADMLNCVWGSVPGMIALAARREAPIVLMHNRPAPDYAGDCVDEVIASLQAAARDARTVGVPAHNIIVDPGIGFGKTPENNIAILARLRELKTALPYALLVGTSRKSTIGLITGKPVDERAFGTAATVALAIAHGADVVRVHDVAAMIDVVRVADAICRR